MVIFPDMFIIAFCSYLPPPALPCPLMLLLVPSSSLNNPVVSAFMSYAICIVQSRVCIEEKSCIIHPSPFVLSDTLLSLLSFAHIVSLLY